MVVYLTEVKCEYTAHSHSVETKSDRSHIAKLKNEKHNLMI